MICHWRAALLLSILYLLVGCASTPPITRVPAAQAHCMQVFIDDDTALAKAGVHDAQATSVAGHPYLRIDRLLASFTDALSSTEQRAAWLARAAALDAQARALEHARLALPPDQSREHELRRCRATLLHALKQDQAAWSALRSAARVPDDYSTARRAFGIYALSSKALLQGVKRMQRSARPHMLDASAADALPTERYGPADATAPTQSNVVAASWQRDALGVPRISADQLTQLLARHAPELAIVTASRDDRPGHIHRASAPYVDDRHATLYTQLAYTRFDDRVLPQLVYTWWFAARTARGVIDPLAGPLDGLSWRVTLDDDGAPLAYDVMHNCGCYHMFFPTARLRTRALTEDGTEPPWIPFTVPADWQGRLRVVLASGSHYVTALAPRSERPSARRYDLRPYDQLRGLHDGERRTSLFDARGLVPGSARGERWLLWPLGVVAADSMRQWGIGDGRRVIRRRDTAVTAHAVGRDIADTRLTAGIGPAIKLGVRCAGREQRGSTQHQQDRGMALRHQG